MSKWDLKGNVLLRIDSNTRAEMSVESIVTSALNSVLLTADILAGDVVEGLLSLASEADNRGAENRDFPQTQQLLKFRQRLLSDVCRIL